MLGCGCDTLLSFTRQIIHVKCNLKSITILWRKAFTEQQLGLLTLVAYNFSCFNSVVRKPGLQEQDDAVKVSLSCYAVCA